MKSLLNVAASLSRVRAYRTETPSPTAEPVANAASSSAPHLYIGAVILGWAACLILCARYLGFVMTAAVAGSLTGTIAIHVVRKNREAIATWLRDVFGAIEFTIGDYCAFCRDVHPCGERCPRAVTGSCSICGPVLLTEWMTCPSPRSSRLNHVIPKTSVHLTTDAEWRRFHIAIRPCCQLSTQLTGDP